MSTLTSFSKSKRGRFQAHKTYRRTTYTAVINLLLHISKRSPIWCFTRPSSTPGCPYKKHYLKTLFWSILQTALKLVLEKRKASIVLGGFGFMWIDIVVFCMRCLQCKRQLFRHQQGACDGQVLQQLLEWITFYKAFSHIKNSKSSENLVPYSTTPLITNG